MLRSIVFFLLFIDVRKVGEFRTFSKVKLEPQDFLDNRIYKGEEEEEKRKKRGEGRANVQKLDERWPKKRVIGVFYYHKHI